MQSLGPQELAYVEKVRQLLRRFGDRAAEDLQAALQSLRQTSHFNVEVPTESSRREWELIKVGVKRLSEWYTRFLAAQLDAFGVSVVRVGETVLARTDRLDDRADDLEARLAVLEQGLAKLEGGPEVERDGAAGTATAAPSRPAPRPKPAKPRRPSAN